MRGFHKRKMERRKAAVEEIKNKLKEEQKKVREERHKEYMKMLKERKEALESLQYDYPNHTVTVTTINDLDLTGASRLEPVDTQATDDSEDEKNEEVSTVPKKAGEPIISKKLSALTASLHARTKQWKKKGTKWEKGQGRTGRGRAPDGKSGATERKSRLGRTSKRQRRRQTGKKIHQQE
ncbi:nucleolar protein 12-like [Scleropages formosus]|uniref:Nucleolar protein 12 n=1 Tax=Scleropages formosus TaxID=113540 RepID=A0A0P7VZV3_SCLFO|nr:nucleolar protein 12-like [Scleropages formosus]